MKLTQSKFLVLLFIVIVVGFFYFKSDIISKTKLSHTPIKQEAESTVVDNNLPSTHLKIKASEMESVKIDIHEKYELENIEYSPEADSLSVDSHYQIRKLAHHLLQHYPDISFVIETHNFESEDDLENEHSSLRMAHALKSAFIKAGINPTQVDIKAFGSKDLEDNETLQNSSKKQKIELLFYALHEE
jgi:outer membrane protein OmpA-like peptidoglycan-associated protein